MTTNHNKSEPVQHPKKPDPDQLKECWEKGLSQRQTAAALGCARRQIRQLGQQLGISWAANAPHPAMKARSQQAALERHRIAAQFRELSTASLQRALTLMEHPDAPAREVREYTTTAAISAQRDLEIATHILKHYESDTEKKRYSPLAQLAAAIRGDAPKLEDLTPDELEEGDLPKGVTYGPMTFDILEDHKDLGPLKDSNSHSDKKT